jgi:hypothetical protein
MISWDVVDTPHPGSNNKMAASIRTFTSRKAPSPRIFLIHRCSECLVKASTALPAYYRACGDEVGQAFQRISPWLAEKLSPNQLLKHAPRERVTSQEPFHHSRPETMLDTNPNPVHVKAWSTVHCYPD